MTEFASIMSDVMTTNCT